MTRAKPVPAPEAGGDQPAIVLVRPQLGQNIGMVARAMLNCGLSDLRLVAPRDGWPNADADAAAANARAVLDHVRVYDDCRAAVAEMARVYATTARPRDQVKWVLTPRAAGPDLRAAVRDEGPAAVLFGPEKTGLENDEVGLADTLIRVPLNPEFTSLNLAQAVLLVAYDWWLAEDPTPAVKLVSGRQPSGRAARQHELDGFMARLEARLEAAGYFNIPEKRPAMMRNLRNIFARARPTKAEIESLHGVISALWSAPKVTRPPRGGADPAPGTDDPDAQDSPDTRDGPDAG
jgi:tRNA/rRNA methyltransferase